MCFKSMRKLTSVSTIWNDTSIKYKLEGIQTVWGSTEVCQMYRFTLITVSAQSLRVILVFSRVNAYLRHFSESRRERWQNVPLMLVLLFNVTSKHPRPPHTPLWFRPSSWSWMWESTERNCWYFCWVTSSEDGSQRGQVRNKSRCSVTPSV